VERGVTLAVHSRYLIDFEYLHDDATGFATMGHLLAFNPSGADTEARVTLFFADDEPTSFALPVPAGQSVETNYTRWPVAPGSRFALQVDCDLPLVCQATVGWNNTWNKYDLVTTPLAPEGVRECAKSYMAHDRLSRESYVADGIVIDRPESVWIREPEWAVLLNPGEDPAHVTLELFHAEVQRHQVVVPPRRLAQVAMDDVVRRNTHYGVRFVSDQPIAAQWLREVHWYDRPDLMTFWSVPAVSLD
jgi:hypothetical protein